MKRVIILAISLFFLLASAAYTELFNCGTDNEGSQLIYDDNLNITWYDHINFALRPKLQWYRPLWI